MSEVSKSLLTIGMVFGQREGRTKSFSRRDDAVSYFDDMVKE